jgi:hypothetical protein
MWIGALFIFGYYSVVVVLAFHGVPETNGNLINNAMLQLGPPVGLIIGALFRTDKTDEKRAENTGKALDAINAAQGSSGSTTTTTVTKAPGGAPAEPQQVEVVNAADQPVPTTMEPTP